MSKPSTFEHVRSKISELAVADKIYKDLTKRIDIASADVDTLFNHLGDLLLQPEHTHNVVLNFRKHVLRILHSAVNADDFEKVDYSWHVRNSVILAKIVDVHPDVEGFVLTYFSRFPAPFVDDYRDFPAFKKRKTVVCYSDADVVEACYSLLNFSVEFFRKKWNWSVFLNKYLNDPDVTIKITVCKCIALLTGMNEQSLHDLLSSYALEKLFLDFECEQTQIKPQSHLTLQTLTAHSDPDSDSPHLICVGGIYLPVFSPQNIKTSDALVEVASTKNNLRRVALALAANKAVCLQGPVGAGKTCLVEYLARRTGRVLGESFIKVQLGDQTDSKMLLGTYRCTDVPGEFVWQPGVLTQAVLDGSWLLLEDIDSASMDIASVLTSLLETSSITIPGYRDNVRATTGFQLFVTQRLLSTATGLHKKHSNAFSLLEKQVLQINVEPLTPEELETIISTSFPALMTIAKRMVNVYLLFTIENRDLVPKSRRLTSTRDLFKWCSRAVVNFDVTSESSALRLLQDAIDIFCCSCTVAEEGLQIAREVASELGIANDKANYFLGTYKPTMGLTAERFQVGRASIVRRGITFGKHAKFYSTRLAANLLERTTCCVSAGEPVLFVGETGTGKTTCVQYLADVVGQKLIVINMNQQSDSADLLGGFKPVDLKFVVGPVKKEFEDVFREFFQVEANKKFLENVNYCFNKQKWAKLLVLMRKSQEAALVRLKSRTEKSCNKRDLQFFERWSNLAEKLEKLRMQIKHKNAMSFSFVEGSLIKAIENGHWVLLDEINLANAETLECLSGLLEGREGSLSILERGDRKPVIRHPNFTLFACMNPSTDVGKKDLPAGLRNRFTEFYVEELTEKADLLLLVNSYLQSFSLGDDKIERIVQFYLTVRKMASQTLVDGLGHKPNFTLRSLCRALTIASRNPCGTTTRSFYEAFCISFLTQLDSISYNLMENVIAKNIVGSPKDVQSCLKMPISMRESQRDKFLQFEGYWINRGALEPKTPENYVLTESVRKNLKDLVRVVSIGKLPVLLQGETSVGKTSLITYLAKSTGNKCVRINNHEHTDLQEYIGSYVADSSGKLVFREGLLVEAMRKGHWIILDELNLAPTDVLEALNRVLDDNRELFIPETQEVVSADPNFMLFATQNPPGVYGGRKMLSRAFRNRFVELHFHEIPSAELEVILHMRCEMPASYARKMVNVMKELQIRRRGSAAFAGKRGFITLRDLFRWGERYRLAENRASLYDWDQHIADEGYLVLSSKVRKPEEQVVIVETLHKIFRRTVEPQNLFSLSPTTSTVTKHILEEIEGKAKNHENIVWTYNMRRNAVLIRKAQEFKEPVLLVGETGGGKTTICKVLADMNGQTLSTVNCHMHTESSDFIGSLRPVRDRSVDVNHLFEWVDGPLIEAIRNGDVFLVDEISLADDSVLERLNSLLEPERSLLVAEKGTDLNDTENSELIIANEKFRFVGTMNPGGDFGKKELSPALRNRFTEIWCEPCTDREDLIAIVERHLVEGVGRVVAVCVMDFIEWLRGTMIGKRLTISIRDILTWVKFINVCIKQLSVSEAYLHGACLTFLDGLGSGTTSTESQTNLTAFRTKCLKFIEKQLQSNNLGKVQDIATLQVEKVGNTFGIRPFFIEVGESCDVDAQFSFNTPTTASNALRLLRGMQLNKAILLEGSPGVGKTSLVTALAKCTRNKIFRVNLSDQTDISDLFGADLPVEGGYGGEFAWRDGPLLRALKQGHWILLDELNLASQSVLEGLNACLDHRGEIFIPELGKTFAVKRGTRFFACQNPLKQGGSRRGLPQSFLNRFIQVYVTSLTKSDYLTILRTQFPNLPPAIVTKMVEFNEKIVSEVERCRNFVRGSPWEFNLRDIVRWCQATEYRYDNDPPDESKRHRPQDLIGLIYADRMRTKEDRIRVRELFEEVFGCEMGGAAPVMYLNRSRVYAGDVWYVRNTSVCNSHVLNSDEKCLVLRKQVSVLRTLLYGVNLNWMCILVGGSGSGKSSVVKTLASLTEQTLKILPVTSAMDTTDILGGFEQTDYTRHLDEIHRQVEQFVLERIQRLFIEGRKEGALDVLRKWESCSRLQDQSADNINQQTTLFLEKLQQLSHVLDTLHEGKQEINQDIEILKNRIESTSNSIKNEGGLSTGGKFEWVDSVLVKCLQEGSWLLVENVNLCSPAVLDRLNGLLEPDGVLTIGERGVDKEGKMVEIEPHPNFRLFLTMDPKNGEISRAMRNRGLEIYLTGLDDGLSGDFDTKSLIGLQGLEVNRHVDALLRIHKSISDDTIVDKPNVQHLLNCAFLIAQQIQRGFGVFEAFKNAITDVYNNTKFDEDEMSRILSHDTNETLDFYTENVTIHANKIHTNSEMQKIKQQCAIVSKFPDSELSRAHLVHALTVSSAEDFDSRRAYISRVLGKTGDNEALFGAVEANVTEFFSKQQACDLPQDSRWLPDLVDVGGEFAANRLFLFLHLTIKFFESRARAKTFPIGERGMTLVEYLNNVKAGRIENSIDDAVASRMLTLMDAYDVFLWSLVYDRTVCTNTEQLIELISMVKWRFVFADCGDANVQKISSLEYREVITNLHVHYKWFVKNGVEGVERVLGAKRTKDLQNIVTKIDQGLVNKFSVLSKLGKCYQRANDAPKPLVNQKQLALRAKFRDCLKRFDVYSKFCDLTDVINVFAAEPELRSVIIDLKIDLAGRNLWSTTDDKLKDLERLSENYTETKVVESVNKYEINVLPLFDHVMNVFARKLKTDFRGTTYEDTFLRKGITFPCLLAGCLLHYKDFRDVSLKHELASEVFAYLLNSAAVRPSRFLNFGWEGDGEVAEVALPVFSPVMTYLSTELLDGGSVTPFGSYRDVAVQRRGINLVFWRNMVPLSSDEFDFVANETKYLQNNHRTFLQQFLASFGLKTSNDNDDDQTLTDSCIEEIERIYNEQDVEYKNEDKALITSFLRNCSQEISALSNSANEPPFVIFGQIGTAYLILSYLKALLNSKIPLIDPLKKAALKKKYCGAEIVEMRALKESFVVQNAIYSDSDETIHPLCRQIEKKLGSLESRMNEYDKFVAVRSPNASYELVVKDVCHMFLTILAPSVISRMYFNFKKSAAVLLNRKKIKDSHMQQIVQCVNKYTTTIVSCENFVNQLHSHRSDYPDIVEPLLGSVMEFLYGMRIMLDLIKGLVKRKKAGEAGRSLGKDLASFVQFPVLDAESTDCVQKIGVYTSSTFSDVVRNVIGDEVTTRVLAQENFRLLKCGLQETFNLCVLQGNHIEVVDKTVFETFDDLLKQFVAAWNRQQTEEEEKRKASESLYKLRTHCETKSEEAEINEELDELFPSFFDKDFADFQPATVLGDGKTSKSAETETEAIILEEDLRFVVNLHRNVVSRYTQSEWLVVEKGKTTRPDFVAPLLQKFHLFKLMLRKSVDFLDYQLDEAVLGSLMVATDAAMNYGSASVEVSTMTTTTSRERWKKTDFYKDANVDEVKECFHILEELRLHVVKLLSEWSEHPTLKTIISLIERIYGFNITSPLSRFLTGLEILLNKCHEWEEVAHSGVSLSEHATKLTQQIITWRKLELNMWKDCLNNTFDRMNAPIAKWWVYLYGIADDYVRDEKVSAKELIETLQKFVAQSNLAEFENRVRLLRDFHCHATHLKQTKRRDVLVGVLWNLQAYFGQFVPGVGAKIKELRSPIEKKLKDYVKIVTWRDVSYWSVKETLRKTQQMLHKYMREFKQVLAQPVWPFLVNSVGETSRVGIWDGAQRDSMSDSTVYVAELSLSETIVVPERIKNRGDSMFGKSGKYFRTARKLCKTTVETAPYPNLTRDLDEFIKNVIESNERLQKLEVDTSFPKEKQKKQAKYIVHQKHRALSDLFKILMQMGVSYRSGLVQSKMEVDFKEFLVKPVDLRAAFAHLNYAKGEESVLAMWDGCEVYYNRCLMRMDVLQRALLQPAKDLGLQNVEKCKGFAFNLMESTQELKENLVETSRCLYYIKYYAVHFEMFCNQKEFLHVNVLNNLQSFAQNALIVLTQCKSIMETCPEDAPLESNFLHIPVLKEGEFIKCKNSRWTKTMDELKEALKIAETLFTTTEKIKRNVPSVEFSLAKMTYVPVNTANLLRDFAELSGKIDSLSRTFGNTSVAKSLRWLSDVGEKLSLSQENAPEIGSNDESCEKKLEQLLKRIVLTVQTMFKRHNVREEQTEFDANKYDYAINEKHISDCVLKNLNEDIAKLRIPETCKLVHGVARRLFRLNPQESSASSVRSLVSCVLPLLEQLILLYQYFVVQQVRAYRVMGKLTSILLNVFIELASKGFCIPPELSDELEKEGSGKQSNGLGLGDGEGEKDVSDRIESEDQLDDAQPAGKEKEQIEQPDCKEEDGGIEMSEDFDSKLQDKKPGEDENESGSDAEEQMGDTEEGADALDKQIWGTDDEEEEENEGKEQKEESGNKGEDLGDKQMSANDETAQNDDYEQPDDKEKKEKKQAGKEINEMDEREFDDEQTDPYHGNQPELPEPEPMDLPDDLELNEPDGEQETQDENPFDIDKQKENFADESETTNETKTTEEEQIPDEVCDEENQDEEQSDTRNEEAAASDNDETCENDDKKKEDDVDGEDETATNPQSDVDQTASAENDIQSMEVDESAAADNVQAADSKDDERTKQNQKYDANNPEKEGHGQSEVDETAAGHAGNADTKLTQLHQLSSSQKRQKRQKPGESNEQRSLGNVKEPVKKKLKTVNPDTKSQDDEERVASAEQDAEMFQHIADAKDNDNTQVLDTATQEQAEAQKSKEVPKLDDESSEQPKESSDELAMEEDEVDAEVTEVKKLSSEKLGGEEKSNAKVNQHPEGEMLDEMHEIQIDGDIVETSTVLRGDETYYRTQYEQLTKAPSVFLSPEEIHNIRSQVQNQLSKWQETPTNDEAQKTWHQISSVTANLAQDLSEQLRLVLEPTQASRLRGDFRTGRRINMRKVIPYIASQFRKDKIWLRRTKPSKRDYQIVLAIDDSSSMADNKSKELTFESVSLISKALTLLESGQLSVLSFGERTEVVHRLGEPFTDESGADLLRRFAFTQTKTCVTELVDFATEMLLSSANSASSGASNAKLLIIIGDGRLSSDDGALLRQAVRRARLGGVFMVFVIVDSPKNKDSILDIRKAVFEGEKCLLESYMDTFPFPFYVVLKDVGCLPSVLSDALRQWFEIVANVEG